MYAVIATGGKQEKVEAGSKLEVELLGAAEGDEVSFTPILVVDGSNLITDKAGLESSKVSATVLGETKGKKIRGFTYKNKTNSRRRWGHRQHYSLVEVTSIGGSAGSAKASKGSAAKAEKAADAISEEGSE